ncbi:MAG TPA: tetratricopeptide repeat protein [Gemmatimonadales bacterium]|nr:tetratricopeptide repeat protein [Gemmatimonadales bacterium]
MKIEQALALLPEFAILRPLRDAVLSAASGNGGPAWSDAGSDLTIGKRAVVPGELAQRIPGLVQQVADHLARLYAAYAGVLEAEVSGDGPATVEALLRAAAIEANWHRARQALGWARVAVRVAGQLQTRRPEVEGLLLVGQLERQLGQYAEAARALQRALALAEGEFDQAGAMAACRGLGAVATAQGDWPGAEAWLTRALGLAGNVGEAAAVPAIRRELGVLAGRQAEFGRAYEQLRQAAAAFEAGRDPAEMARTLDAFGAVEVSAGRHAEAMARLREALAWARRVERDGDLEVGIRLTLAALFEAMGQSLEAEQELRRAEQVATATGRHPRLIEIYVRLGDLRGDQRDEGGFVFFEQAIILCRKLECGAVAEADVFRRYGRFRAKIGQHDDARNLLAHARELLQALGSDAHLRHLDDELAQLGA